MTAFAHTKVNVYKSCGILSISAMHNMHIWIAKSCNFTIFASVYEFKLNAKSGDFEVVDSGIQLPIPLIFNVHMYSKMADSPKIGPRAESARGIGHFKISTFSCLSSMYNV